MTFLISALQPNGFIIAGVVVVLLVSLFSASGALAYTLTADGTVRFTRIGPGTYYDYDCNDLCGRAANAVNNARGTCAMVLNAAEGAAAVTEMAGQDVLAGGLDTPDLAEVTNTWVWRGHPSLGPFFTATATGVGTCHQGYCPWDTGQPTYPGNSCLYWTTVSSQLAMRTWSCGATKSYVLCRHEQVASQSSTTSTYYILRNTAVLSWTEARDACHAFEHKGQRGHLATVETADDHAVITAITRGVPVWVGGTNAANYSTSSATWKWAVGLNRANFFTSGVGCVAGKYCNWAAGAPDATAVTGDRCMQLDATNTYSDVPCSTPRYYVCEYVAGTAHSNDPAPRVFRGYPSNLGFGNGPPNTFCSATTILSSTSFGWPATLNSAKERRAFWESGRDMPLNNELMWTGHYDQATTPPRDYRYEYGPTAEQGTFWIASCLPGMYCSFRAGDPGLNANQCELYYVIQAATARRACGDGPRPFGCEYRGDVGTPSASNRRRSLEFFSSPKSWPLAKDACAATLVNGVPGYLADISNDEVASHVDFFRSVAAVSGFIWTGGRSDGPGAAWSWSGAIGNSVFYGAVAGQCASPPCNWKSGAPSSSVSGEKCLSVANPSYQWTDSASCSSSLSYVCEWNRDVAISQTKVYVAQADSVSWTEAVDRCRFQHSYWGQRGRLARFDTNTQFTALTTLLGTGVSIWIGAKQSDSIVGTYSFIAHDEPDKPFYNGACIGSAYCPAWSSAPSGSGCVSSASSQLTLQSTCTTARRYVCEFESTIAFSKADRSQHQTRYQLYATTSLSWSAAAAACTTKMYLGKPGVLAQVMTHDEMTAAVSLTTTAASFWIGGTDTGAEGRWRWAFGSREPGTLFNGALGCQQSYCRWANSATPTSNSAKNCLSVSSTGWVDTICGTAQAYLCSWAAMTFTPSISITRASLSRTRATLSNQATATTSRRTVSKSVSPSAASASSSVSKTRKSVSVSASFSANCEVPQAHASVFHPFSFTWCCALPAMSSLSRDQPAPSLAHLRARLSFDINVTQPQAGCYLRRTACLGALVTSSPNAGESLVDWQTANGTTFDLFQVATGGNHTPSGATCAAISNCFQNFTRCVAATFVVAIDLGQLGSGSCPWPTYLRRIAADDRARLDYGPASPVTASNASIAVAPTTGLEAECIVAFDEVLAATRCETLPTAQSKLTLCRGSVAAWTGERATSSLQSTSDAVVVESEGIAVDRRFDTYFGSTSATCPLCVHKALSTGTCGCDNRSYEISTWRLAHASIASPDGSGAVPSCFASPFTLAFCRQRGTTAATVSFMRPRPWLVTTSGSNASASSSSSSGKRAEQHGRVFRHLQSSLAAPTAVDLSNVTAVLASSPCPTTNGATSRWFQLLVAPGGNSNGTTSSSSSVASNDFSMETVFVCIPAGESVFIRHRDTGTCDEPPETSTSVSVESANATATNASRVGNSTANVTTKTATANRTVVSRVTSWKWCAPCSSVTSPRSWPIAFVNRTTFALAPGVMTYCAALEPATLNSEVVSTMIISSVVSSIVDAGGSAGALQAIAVLTGVSCGNSQARRGTRAASAATPLAVGTSPSSYWLGSLILMLAPMGLHFLLFLVVGIKNVIRGDDAVLLPVEASGPPAATGHQGDDPPSLLHSSDSQDLIGRPWLHAVHTCRFPNLSLLVLVFTFQGFSYESFALVVMWHIGDMDPSLDTRLRLGPGDRAAAVIGVLLVAAHVVVTMAAVIYAHRVSVVEGSIFSLLRRRSLPPPPGMLMDESPSVVAPMQAWPDATVVGTTQAKAATTADLHANADAPPLASGSSPSHVASSAPPRFVSYERARVERFQSVGWTLVMATGFWQASTTFVLAFGSLISTFGDRHFVFTSAAAITRVLLVSLVSALALALPTSACRAAFIVVAVVFFGISFATLVTRPYRFLFATFANVFLGTAAGVIALKAARPDIHVDSALLTSVVTWGSIACSVVGVLLLLIDVRFFQKDALAREAAALDSTLGPTCAKITTYRHNVADIEPTQNDRNDLGKAAAMDNAFDEEAIEVSELDVQRQRDTASSSSSSPLNNVE